MNTKLHAVTDADGRPIRFFMTAGQVSDYTGAAALIGSLPKAVWLLADRGYDADNGNCEPYLITWTNIPKMFPKWPGICCARRLTQVVRSWNSPSPSRGFACPETSQSRVGPSNPSHGYGAHDTAAPGGMNIAIDPARKLPACGAATPTICSASHFPCLIQNRKGGDLAAEHLEGGANPKPPENRGVS